MPTHMIGRIRRRARRAVQMATRPGGDAVRRALRAGDIQAKLRVGAENDAYEREADAMAARVMAGPAAPAAALTGAEARLQRRRAEGEDGAAGGPDIQRQSEDEQKEEELQAKARPEGLQRQTSEEEEEEEIQAKARPDGLQRQTSEEEEKEEEIQPKAKAGGAFDAPAGVSSAVSSLRGGGQPLPHAPRRFFETRFGADFSSVRVHHGDRAAAAADAVNARAFTTGRDIVFAKGEYAPATRSGGELLAHELTHVLQQRGERDLQRKIKVESGVAIDAYFARKKVDFVTKTGQVYGHPGASYQTLTQQIIADLLISAREFAVPGSVDSAAEKNLDDHVRARKGIVDFAAKKKYTFGAGSKMKMNPKYWRKVGAGWNVKPGVDPMKAMRDVNVTPAAYSIACLTATRITMLAGSGGSPYTPDTGVAKDDWVPGDWGYITNTKFTGKAAHIGLEGENIIYASEQKYWGHFSGSNTYRTLDGWMKEVKGWNGGARLESYRKRPTKGLV